MKFSKKMLGLVILVCFVVVVSGCTSNNNQSSSNTPSTNTSSSNSSSSTDVYAVISYSGPWAADVSGNLGYRALAGTGDQTTNLGSVSGPVTVSARKTEGGSGVLTVSITKGGKSLSTSSTSSPWGGATAYTSV
jgi:hypothetical protein